MSTYEDSDVRTVQALEKIKAILRDHDLWGSFIVVSEKRVHWLYHFDPSWSCLHLGPNGEARIRAKRADFASPEQHKRVVELTTGAIASTRDFAAKQFGDTDQLYKMLEGHFDEIVHEYSDPKIRKGE